MSHPAISQAIYYRISADLGHHPIAWPNVRFPPKGQAMPSGPYLRVNEIPGETQPVGLSRLDDTISILQIAVMMPAGLGAIAAAETVQEVLAAFPRNLKLDAGGVTINFNRTGWASAALQDGDRYMVPVSIPYRVLA